MKRFMTAVALTGAFCALQAVPAGAAPITLTGVCSQVNAPGDTSEEGECSKTLSYDLLVGGVDNQVRITLTNTTPVALGGFITADAFALPTGVNFSLFTSTDPDFTLAPLTGGQPSGAEVESPITRNFVISTSSGDFEGGGTPSLGIGVAPNNTATFTFVTSRELTEAEVRTLFSSEAIRFRGFVSGASDKDLIVAPPTPDVRVPEPTSMLLLGLGLTGLAAGARRKLGRA